MILRYATPTGKRGALVSSTHYSGPSPWPKGIVRYSSRPLHLRNDHAHRPRLTSSLRLRTIAGEAITSFFSRSVVASLRHMHGA